MKISALGSDRNRLGQNPGLRSLASLRGTVHAGFWRLRGCTSFATTKFCTFAPHLGVGIETAEAQIAQLPQTCRPDLSRLPAVVATTLGSMTLKRDRRPDLWVYDAATSLRRGSITTYPPGIFSVHPYYATGWVTGLKLPSLAGGLTEWTWLSNIN